jgi:Tat protein translocase TatB subunit
MFDLGMQELIVIFIVALLVFGPRKLPELAKSLGKGVAHLKKAMFDIKYEMDRELDGVNAPNLDDLPDWKAENLKKVLQEKALEASGIKGPAAVEGEDEGAPRDKGLEHGPSEGPGAYNDPYEGDSGEDAPGSEEEGEGEEKGV